MPHPSPIIRGVRNSLDESELYTFFLLFVLAQHLEINFEDVINVINIHYHKVAVFSFLGKKVSVVILEAVAKM